MSDITVIVDPTPVHITVIVAEAAPSSGGASDAILPYTTQVAALAATGVTPRTDQMVSVLDTKRAYLGDGTSTVAQLVTAQAYLLPVEEYDKGIRTTTLGETLQIQLNEQ